MSQLTTHVLDTTKGKPAEGIIVDLHVVRVAPRLSIAKGTDANKIEKQLMEVLDKMELYKGVINEVLFCEA